MKSFDERVKEKGAANDEQPTRKADKEEGRRLLKEGDNLADKKEYDDAIGHYKQAFEQLLPNMRKIFFKKEVKRDATSRKDLRAYLIKEMDEDQTPEEFKGDETAMKALA